MHMCVTLNIKNRTNGEYPMVSFSLSLLHTHSVLGNNQNHQFLPYSQIGSVQKKKNHICKNIHIYISPTFWTNSSILYKHF